MPVNVGLDISAYSVDVVIRQGDKASQPKQYKQSVEGHAALISQLKKAKPRLIVMEATGIYYFDLAVALADAGLPVAVINPKSFRHFAELKLQTSKSDGIDADLLAEYGQRMAPALWTPPDQQHQALRSLGRQINRLVGSRAQAKNRLHALKATRSTPALLIEDEQEGIATLESRIERLRQAALDLMAEAPVLQRQYEHLLAAKGVGEATALSVLAELCVLPRDLKSSQVSRHAGLDVRQHQSGTSVNRPGRISKAGNVYLRSALYMPALSAVRYDPNAKAFYEALVARGKKKIQALVAVMRKYLTGLWACLKTDTPFDSSRLFQPQGLQNA
ncbi:IS110 family transposase [Alloalcanivorax xenomutans]|uniref:IS110 family transposase n=1 Tax=Alloalcanivorax xenomutans TaxID=1094342 RepID=UPI003A80F9CC